MLKLLTIITALQVFTASCNSSKKIRTVNRGIERGVGYKSNAIISDTENVVAKAPITISPTVTGAVSYAWSQTAGPGSLTFASPSSHSTVVSASADGSYVIRLTATDAAGHSTQKDIDFTWDTTPPIIGDASDIFANSWVVVSPSVADAVNYAWTQVSGPGLIIFARPSSHATAVSASADGAYVMRLTATDAAGNIAEKEINFTWDTIAPVITVETQQTLYGMTASINPVVTGGDSYSWTHISGPGTAMFSNATTQSTTITVNKHGSYTVHYVVQDRAGNIAQQQITRYFNDPHSRSLATGYDHTCAILAGDSVTCWGGNGSGQLGYGNRNQLLAPAATSINLGPGKTALAIYASPWRTCALLNDNSLKCWGEGNNYALGQGSNTDLLAPAASPINFGSGKTALAIDGGWDHTCALLNDSSVRCWGSSYQGQAGIGVSDGYVTSPLAAEINFGLGKTAVAISAGGSHTCAILNEGSVKCWGDGWYGQLGISGAVELSAPAVAPIDLGPEKTALAISAGDQHTCAILNDDSVKCWGSGYSGQLGNGIADELREPAAASIDLGPGKTATAIASGAEHTCALLNDKSVKCWGNSSRGQLGYGNTTNLLVPDTNSINLGEGKTAVAISAKGYHTCVRLDDNSLKCWGQGWSGQLGYGNTNNLLAPDANPINLNP